MGIVADRVRSSLLEPGGLKDHHLWLAIEEMMRPGIEAADVYLQSRVASSATVRGGRLVGSVVLHDRGMGLRAMTATGDGFCFTQLIDPAEMARGAQIAGVIADNPNGERRQRLDKTSQSESVTGLPDRLVLARRIEMMAAIEAQAHAFDTRVVAATVSLTVDEEEVLLATDLGLLYTDVRCFSRITLQLGIQIGGQTYQGNAARGFASDEFAFLDSETTLALVRRAVQAAELRAQARPFEGGVMSVVMAAGWSGVLFHEAVGHGLEGDLAARGISPYSGRIGQAIAAPGCTIMDDGTLAGRAGTRGMDDEGTVSQATTLVEDGILKSYMHDRRSARNAGVAPTGNGRRQSYANLPMPRMTNTYLAPGSATPADVIASVDRGLYCADIGSGQVDLVSGHFVFGSVGEAYAIEGGKLTYPVSGVRLMGSGPQVIARIGMVANDLDFDSGVASCGKSTQNLLVGVGQPTIRIDELTVGGNA